MLPFLLNETPADIHKIKLKVLQTDVESPVLRVLLPIFVLLFQLLCPLLGVMRPGALPNLVSPGISQFQKQSLQIRSLYFYVIQEAVGMVCKEPVGFVCLKMRG